MKPTTPGYREKAEHAALTRDIARGGGIAFMGGMFGKVSILGLNVILGRFLGPVGYGLYALGRSVAGILQFIAALGLNQGVVRFCSIYKEEKDYSRLKGMIVSALVIAFVFSGLLAVLLFFFANTLALEFFHEPGLKRVLQLFALSIPFATLTTIFASFAQSFKRIDAQQIILNIIRPIFHLVMTGLLFLLSFRLAASVWSFTVSWIVGTLTGLLYLIKIFPRDFLKTKAIYQVKKLLRFSIPTFFTGLSYLLLTYTDRLMLGYFGEARDVGIYNAATTISLQIPIFLTAFVAIFMPMISDLYHRGETGKLNSLFKTVTRWIFILSFPLVMGVFLFRDFIMGLFGAPFVAGAPVLLILGLAQLVNVGTGPVGMVLKMTGKQDVDFTNGIILVLLNIGLNFWLITKYGVMGAALATCVSIALMHFVRLIEVFILLKLFPYEWPYLKPISAGAMAYGTVLIVKNILDPTSWYGVLLAGAVLVSIYFAILWLLGIDQEDRLVLNLVKRKFLKAGAK